MIREEGNAKLNYVPTCAYFSCIFWTLNPSIPFYMQFEINLPVTLVDLDTLWPKQWDGGLLPLVPITVSMNVTATSPGKF
jgi:hypothetical protein